MELRFWIAIGISWWSEISMRAKQKVINSKVFGVECQPFIKSVLKKISWGEMAGTYRVTKGDPFNLTQGGLLAWLFAQKPTINLELLR